MYVLNKIVGGLLSPLAVTMILILVAAACVWFRHRRVAVGVLLGAFAWQWVWGTSAWNRVVGLPLEMAYPVVKAEDALSADAIVVLGGGMTSNPPVYPYADICEAGDRAWHAARLYRAGKAPLVIPTGCEDLTSVVPLLEDLGVPRNAIRVENRARNTEENARFVAEMLKGMSASGGAAKPRILLVTSAQHMRRALLMYRRYAPDLDIVPAATDYNALVCTKRPWECSDFFPGAECLLKNTAAAKEIIGYWGYRLLRR